MTVDDLIRVIEAIGDSWPAALVLITGVAGFIAWKALPRLKEITEGIGAILHELHPNSGKSLKDQTNRTEAKLDALIERFDEHKTASDEWHANADAKFDALPQATAEQLTSEE